MAGTANSGGRNRKTAEQHRRDGTFQRCRHGDPAAAAAATPDPPKGQPAPPADLADEALAEWRRMVARLELSRTLSLVDDAVLYRYCQLHARAERLEAAIAKLKSPFYLDHMGNERVHPAFAQLRSHDQTLRGYLVEFGLTPAARSRVKASDPPQGAADPFAQFEGTDDATH
jgi:P27 family predicted phage terminase small subunit